MLKTLLLCLQVALAACMMSCASSKITPSRIAFVFVNFDEREVSLSIDDRNIVDRQMLYDEYPEVGESLLVYVELAGTSNAVLTIDGEVHSEQLFITPKTKTVYVRTIPDYLEESDYEPLLD